jgi:hypothetical protein
MSNSVSSALRDAAEQINAQRSAWDGVGFMAIENLETGACGLVLVPKGTPRPDWSRELQDASPGWERHEDLQLAQWLPRGWGADLSIGDRFPELMNLLNRHIPARLLAQLPAPSRHLACGYGLGVHALPAVAGSSELLGRLVAWLQPWERLVVDPAGRNWAHHLLACPCAGLRMWNPACCGMGASGRTSEERIAATGALEWGLIAGWSSVIDAVVAYLVAMADTMEAAPSLPAGDVTKEKHTRIQGRLRRLSKDRRHVVLVAVHEVATRTRDKAPPGKTRQETAYKWAHDNKQLDIRTHLASASSVWCPQWFVDLLCKEYRNAVTVEDLLEVCDEPQFRDSVRKGMKPEQQEPPSAFVPFE